MKITILGIFLGLVCLAAMTALVFLPRSYLRVVDGRNIELSMLWWTLLWSSLLGFVGSITLLTKAIADSRSRQNELYWRYRFAIIGFYPRS